MLILFASFFFTSVSATLTGRVTAPTGAALSEVEVLAINVETGLKFSTQTNEEGIYRITNLPPGTYRVQFRKHGFRTIVRSGVELHVQDVIALNFELRIGSIDQSITEEEGMPLLQAETAILGQTIDRNAIAELPVLLANPYNSINLSSGAAPMRNYFVRGVGFAVNGQRPESANFLLDGSNYNTNPEGNNPGQTLPNEAVREYRLLTNSFTAEYGRTAGFIANLVTRSGTNEFHGSLYEYARNSALAANSFENNALGKRKTNFNGHHTGGSIGGPIVSDKVFFFGALETTPIRSSDVQRYYVPTPDLVAITPPAIQAIFSKYPLPANLSSTDVVYRTVIPFTGGVPVSLPIFARATRLGPIDTGAGAPQNSALGIMRVDYGASARTMITARHAFQHVDLLATVRQPYAKLDTPVQIRNHNATVNLTRVWSANAVTESRLSFSRLANIRVGAGPNGAFHYLDISSDWNVSLPYGPATEGGPRNLYQTYQTASWVRRNHHFKFGGEFVHYRDALDVAFPGVVAWFRDVNFFVAGALDLGASSLNAGFDKTSDGIGKSIAPPNRRWHLRHNDVAWFVQDTWKLTQRLTLTPGLRWEYFGVHSSPGHEKARDLNFYLGDGATHYERFINGKVLRTTEAPGAYRNHYTRPDRNNFGPRAGMAFDVSGDGRTVFRAGGGVYFDAPFGRVPTQIRESLAFSDIPFTPEMLDNPYTIAGSPTSSTPHSIKRSDPDGRIPYVAAWNATLEREFAGSVALSASYVGSSGSKLELAVAENGIGSGRYVGRPNERLLNNYGTFSSIKSLAHSSYHSLQLKLEGRRIRPLGLQFGANYTWGHSIDNASERYELDRGLVLDSNYLRFARASSSFDQRHRFVTHFIWETPAIRAAPRFIRQISAGWQLSGILSFQTGQPFNLIDQIDYGSNQYSRPRVTGPLPQVLGSFEMIPDPEVPNRFLYLRGSQTRTYPGGPCKPNATPFACASIAESQDNLLPRNFYRGPGSYFQDFALTRNVRFAEKARVQVRAEFYNLFNHANRELLPDFYYGGYELASPVFAGNTESGVLARYGGIPRQVVLAAKIIF